MTDQALKTTPLNAAHRALGARMVGFGGYDMPVQYEGVLAEHRWTREHAGLFDVSHMGQCKITGEDAIAQFERFVPGDYAILKAGKQKYSLLLNTFFSWYWSLTSSALTWLKQLLATRLGSPCTWATETVPANCHSP